MSNTDKAIELAPCPFCGSENIEKKFIGNDRTKKRSVEVTCKGCFIKRVTGAIYHSHEWCDEKATEAWNTRHESETKAQAVEEVLQKIRYYIKHNDFESREDDLAQGQLIACENISKILEQLRDGKQ